MTDIFSKGKRSKVMGLIRSRGNRTTELRLVELMRQHGLAGWRRHLKLPGQPDFTFPKQRVCVFVHGCFWHGCPHCRRIPKTNAKFWKQKITANQKRDSRVSILLRKRGFKVLTVWECGLRNKSSTYSLRRIQCALLAPRRAR